MPTPDRDPVLNVGARNPRGGFEVTRPFAQFDGDCHPSAIAKEGPFSEGKHGMLLRPPGLQRSAPAKVAVTAPVTEAPCYDNFTPPVAPQVWGSASLACAMPFMAAATMGCQPPGLGIGMPTAPLGANGPPGLGLPLTAGGAAGPSTGTPVKPGWVSQSLSPWASAATTQSQHGRLKKGSGAPRSKGERVS
jgi:hypothetical protein